MNTKQELQIVSFEQAKRLKALGFDWKVRSAYNQNEAFWKGYYDDNHNCYECKYSAPSVALALKWIRDVKGIVYSIERDFLCKKWMISPRCGDDCTEQFSTYELAESALLDALLTLLEKGDAK